jgi:hypothetical protein
MQHQSCNKHTGNPSTERPRGGVGDLLSRTIFSAFEFLLLQMKNKAKQITILTRVVIEPIK